MWDPRIKWEVHRSWWFEKSSCKEQQFRANRAAAGIPTNFRGQSQRNLGYTGTNFLMLKIRDREKAKNTLLTSLVWTKVNPDTAETLAIMDLAKESQEYI